MAGALSSMLCVCVFQTCDFIEVLDLEKNGLDSGGSVCVLNALCLCVSDL